VSKRVKKFLVGLGVGLTVGLALGLLVLNVQKFYSKVMYTAPQSGKVLLEQAARLRPKAQECDVGNNYAFCLVHVKGERVWVLIKDTQGDVTSGL
jgi:gas vesicle protein